MSEVRLHAPRPRPSPCPRPPEPQAPPATYPSPSPSPPSPLRPCPHFPPVCVSRVLSEVAAATYRLACNLGAIVLVFLLTLHIVRLAHHKLRTLGCLLHLARGSALRRSGSRAVLLRLLFLRLSVSNECQSSCVRVCARTHHSACALPRTLRALYPICARVTILPRGSTLGCGRRSVLKGGQPGEYTFVVVGLNDSPVSSSPPQR